MAFLRTIIPAAVAILAPLLLCAPCAIAQQSPSIEWEKTYGGSKDDRAHCIQQTSDSGYIVAGYAESSDGDVTGFHATNNTNAADYWIVKLNTRGDLQWQKDFGGTREDKASWIRQTSDGGYIVAGSTSSTDGDVLGQRRGGLGDYWIVKLNAVGTLQWEKALGDSSDDRASSVEQTSDGGYIAFGISNGESSLPDGDVIGSLGYNDLWLVKLTAAGTIQWQRPSGSPFWDNVSGNALQTKDGGYVAVGTVGGNGGDVTGFHGWEDAWVMKVNSSGNLVWEKALGGSGSDIGVCMRQTADGGYIVLASNRSSDGDVTGNHGGIDWWIVKLDSLGALQWEKSIGGSNYDYPSSIQTTRDGGFVVTGGTSSSDGDFAGFGISDGVVFKFSASGIIEWKKNLYGDILFSVQETRDSGFIVAGARAVDNHFNDFLIAKLRFIPIIASLQQLNFDPLLCDTVESVPVWIYNTGSKNLLIDSASFSIAGQPFSFDPVSFPVVLVPGDSLLLTIRFAASNAGAFASTLNIYSNDAAHWPWPIAISGLKKIIRTSVTGLKTDTLDFGHLACGSTKDMGFLLKNLSTFGTSFLFQIDRSRGFTLTTDSIQFLSAGSQTIVETRFVAQSGSGVQIDSLRIIDTCGNAQTVFVIATVDSAMYSIASLMDTTICLGDSIVRSVLIKNLSASAQTFQHVYHDSLFSIWPGTAALGAGDSATMNIVFHGSATKGTYSLRDSLIDDCGGVHLFTTTIRVDNASVIASAIPDAVICPGDSVVRTVMLRNVSNITQTVSLPGDGMHFSIIPGTITLAPGDSTQVQIVFHGSSIIGTYSLRNTLPSGCGGTNILAMNVRVDTASVAATAIGDTTICAGDSIIRTKTIRNTSTVTQTFSLTGSGSALWVATPSSVTLAPGESITVTLAFRGSTIGGDYIALFRLPGCGAGNALSALVHVDVPRITVPAAFALTVCPFVSLSFSVIITNGDTIARQVNCTSTSCSVSPQQKLIASGGSDSIIATFPASDTGTYQCTIHVTDDCGIAHDVAVTIDVHSLPPLAIALQSDAMTLPLGTERSIRVIASPPGSVASGMTFAVTNEPTALFFDSVSSRGTIIAARTGNTVQFRVASEPWSGSDTMATLHYRTLVGSTLAPTVTLENVSTVNACNVVTGSGSAAIALLPPGCELGTVAVHPYTTAIQSIYPNPATGITTITYSTIEEANVTMEVHDALGRTVRSLVNAMHKPGQYIATFDPQEMTSGVFYVVMHAGKYSAMKELLLMQ